MIYLIPVAWQMYGRVEIEAGSPEEAFKKAERDIDHIRLPEGSYLDGSFEIDHDGIVMDENGNICD